MREATENPAITPWPESASNRVTMPVDSGATRFDAVAGNPTCRICARRLRQPAHARNQHAFFHHDPVHAQHETDEPRGDE